MSCYHFIRDFWENEITDLGAYIKWKIPVSIANVWSRDWVEKNLMWRSAVPPPEAKTEGLLGHHPMALTAALCSWNLTNYALFFIE